MRAGRLRYKRHAPTRSRRPEVKYLYHASIKRIVLKVNTPPANRCQIPRRTCRVALILRPSWNSACWTPAFILMGMCGRNAHRKTAPSVTCEPRDACDAKTVALPRASAFTPAAAPRGAWLFSCLRGLPTPGSRLRKVCWHSCASGPVWCRLRRSGACANTAIDFG